MELKLVSVNTAKQDGVVSRPVTARPYHHGNLRAALLSAALEELQHAGPGGLSLREVARRAGVSHSAPRHHFGDKRGLLTAVAADGYRRLGDATARAADDGLPLEQVGLAYVRFALGSPGHFGVMFRPDLYDADDDELQRERDRAAQVLLAAVAADLPADASADQILSGAVAAWSMTHGFATLWAAGNLLFTGASDAAQLAEAAFAALRRTPASS